MTGYEVVELIRSKKILWDATPASIQASGEIRSQEDIDRLNREAEELVGCGYFYVDVRNMDADLAFMYCPRPHYWETVIVPKRISPLLEDDLVRSVESAGGAINWSGHYPLDEIALDKVRQSYIGVGV